MTFAPGEYPISFPDAAPAEPDPAALIVRGDDITLDFSGAVLRGADASAAPDSYRGVALRIDGGRNIVIKNLTVRGCKVGILGRNARGLKLVNCDLSYNYRPRLRSTLEREDPSDWLSYHHNERDEWLRYGAGIYLHDCDDAEVRGCTVTGGQNGLLMTRCEGGLIWNNTFSFNSGVGVGLYRSSHNRVMHNKLDFNVRGYSHGVYHRGQDSAAILVYEQSSNNTFAWNSATHSGDGLFLWAGHTTMDSGQGGCNDNLIYGNDFSCAPTNGIEVTFSRNQIISNRIEECWHGIWGGYSYQTVIHRNRFAGNDEAIAIEHGQDNLITGNTFRGDRVAIRLWQNAKQDPDWGYPKHRDTRSRDYAILGNSFTNVARPFDITDTDNVVREPAAREDPRLHARVEPLPGGQDARLPAEHPRGRRFILVDEWGPYDFRSPKLWPREKLADGRLRFDVLGPPGKWRIASHNGVAGASAKSGQVPGEIVVSPETGRVVDLDLQLEYIGGEVVSPFGVTSPAGTAYRFGYSRFHAPVDWTVKWFAYDAPTDPRQRYDAFRRLLAGPPLKQERTAELAYTWPGTPAKNLPGSDLPADRFATLAEGTVQLPPGRYQIEVTSDDGVRVWVDGKKVIDNWTWHVPTTDVATLELGGKHRIRVEHFEIDGYATLQFRLRRP